MILDAESDAAFRRLLKVARSDTSASRIVANFILSWWNADVHGGFDFGSIGPLDTQRRTDILLVITFILERGPIWPDEHEAEIIEVIRQWRGIPPRSSNN